MQALALGGLRIMTGKEKSREFHLEDIRASGQLTFDAP